MQPQLSFEEYFSSVTVFVTFETGGDPLVQSS